MNTFWMIYNNVPWWLPLVIIIVLVAGFWNFIAPIWALLPGWLRWAIIGAITLGGAIQYGRNRGEQAAEKKREDDNAAAVETRKQIDAKVDAMPDKSVVDDLQRNKWLRD